MIFRKIKKLAPSQEDKAWDRGSSNFIILNWIRSICFYFVRDTLKLRSDIVFSWEGRQEVLFYMIYGFFPFKMAYFFMKGLFSPEDSLITTITTNNICIDISVGSLPCFLVMHFLMRCLILCS